MPKKKKLLQLNRTLVPIDDNTLAKYRQLYLQHKQEINAKDVGDFISQILEAIYPVVATKDLKNLDVIQILENLKNSGYYIIPVNQSAIAEYKIYDDKIVDTFLLNYNPKNLVDGIKTFLNLHTAGVIVTPRKEGICDEIQISFRFKPDRTLEQILSEYVKALIVKLGYRILEVKDTNGNMTFLCCK